MLHQLMSVSFVLLNLLKVVQHNIPHFAPIFIALKQIALLSVKKLTVTSEVSHAHHKTGVPLQVIHWHHIKLGDGIVLGYQEHDRNANLMQVMVTRNAFVELVCRGVAD